MIIFLVTSVANLVMAEISITSPAGASQVTTRQWLGWASLCGGALAFSFVLKRAAEIRRRDERLCRGRCENCGYDLRAAPEKCPECGKSMAER